MTITKQQLIDKYNEVYAADNGINKTFNQLTKDEKVEALLQFITAISGGSEGGGSVSETPATTAALTSVANSITSVTILAANPNRRTVIISNNSSAALYLTFGATASTSTFTTTLAPLSGGIASNVVLNRGDYTGVISGIWASGGGGDAQITETV
jgi:hypothetical protein